MEDWHKVNRSVIKNKYFRSHNNHPMPALRISMPQAGVV